MINEMIESWKTRGNSAILETGILTSWRYRLINAEANTHMQAHRTAIIMTDVIHPQS